MKLVKVPHYFKVVVGGDIFHPGPAWSDEGMKALSAVDTGRYRVHFVKKGYSLPAAVHFLPYFKRSSLESFSRGTVKSPQSVLRRPYSGILPADGMTQRNAQIPGQSTSQDGAVPAALACRSRQSASDLSTKHLARKSRKK